MPSKKTVEKKTEENRERFAFRIKIGEYEIGISGKHEEVNKTIEDLPKIVANINKAFESLKPKTIATLTVKTEASQKQDSDESAQTFPRISASDNCEEAVFRILGTDWGKWRPRTMQELREAINANGLKYSDHVLSETLDKLTKKGMVHRWNTNTGFVYILAKEKSIMPRKES